MKEIIKDIIKDIIVVGIVVIIIAVLVFITLLNIAPSDYVDGCINCEPSIFSFYPWGLGALCVIILSFIILLIISCILPKDEYGKFKEIT